MSAHKSSRLSSKSMWVLGRTLPVARLASTTKARHSINALYIFHFAAVRSVETFRYKSCLIS